MKETTPYALLSQTQSIIVHVTYFDLKSEGRENVPVSVYPCSIAWHVCSERISITLPPFAREATSHWKFLPLSRSTASSLFDTSSSGEKTLKVLGFLTHHKKSLSHHLVRVSSFINGCTHLLITSCKNSPTTFIQLSCFPFCTPISIHFGTSNALKFAFASFLIPIFLSFPSGTILKTSSTGLPSSVNSSCGL